MSDDANTTDKYFNEMTDERTADETADAFTFTEPSDDGTDADTDTAATSGSDTAGSGDPDAPAAPAGTGGDNGFPTDPTKDLERPSCWNDALEREFRAEVSETFKTMVQNAEKDADAKDKARRAYRELSTKINDTFKELSGRDLPATVAANVDQMLMQITMAPPREPEHGPGLWAKMPQNGINSMVEARPVDLTGSPDRARIDLMMLHTIRMGRFLTTHYVEWAQTLPACWIRHDDVVQEVFALKCYMDMIVASPNGGLYAPTLQSYIQSALGRVKEYLNAASAQSNGHGHHLSSQSEREQERLRREEYNHWFERGEGWADEPGFGPEWGFDDTEDGLRTACDLMTPTRADDTEEDLAGRIGHWRNQLRGFKEDYDTHRTASAVTGAERIEQKIRKEWTIYEARDREARDRLDKARAAAEKRLRVDPSSAPDGLRELADQARAFLAAHGSKPKDEGYEPCSIELQDDLTKRLNTLMNGDSSKVFDRCDMLLDRLAATGGRKDAGR